MSTRRTASLARAARARGPSRPCASSRTKAREAGCARRRCAARRWSADRAGGDAGCRGGERGDDRDRARPVQRHLPCTRRRVARRRQAPYRFRMPLRARRRRHRRMGARRLDHARSTTEWYATVELGITARPRHSLLAAGSRSRQIPLRCRPPPAGGENLRPRPAAHANLPRDQAVDIRIHLLRHHCVPCCNRRSCRNKVTTQSTPSTAPSELELITPAVARCHRVPPPSTAVGINNEAVLERSTNAALVDGDPATGDILLVSARVRRRLACGCACRPLDIHDPVRPRTRIWRRHLLWDSHRRAGRDRAIRRMRAGWLRRTIDARSCGAHWHCRLARRRAAQAGPPHGAWTTWAGEAIDQAVAGQP